jgi:biotin synthase
MQVISTITNWSELAKAVIEGYTISAEEANSIMASSDDELLTLLDAAFTIRRHYWGKRVNVHILENAKSGMCRENCKFCSQAMGAYSGVDRYGMHSVEELVEGAKAAKERKAVKYCIVTATRGPAPKELEVLCEAVRKIKAEVDIQVCASLGLLNREQAEQLAAAGVDRFNHNLETSEAYYPEICNTHTFDDRLQTLKFARDAGMEACCGGIMGMGESLADRVDLALTLRDLKVESIPINFLDPRPGTPLGHLERLSPQECLRCLCLFRFTNPSVDLRTAGGREVCLKQMQPLALYVANSLFSDGYLTTGGQGNNQDEAMIAEAGFEVADLSVKE